jgi:hypothetical protein
LKVLDGKGQVIDPELAFLLFRSMALLAMVLEESPVSVMHLGPRRRGRRLGGKQSGRRT